MTNKLSKQIIYVAGIVVVLAFMYLLGASAVKVGASAPPGVRATMATTTTMAVSTSASLLMATTSACTARIVTTYASPVMLTFFDASTTLPSVLPTGTIGHLQAASTTVAYDSGQYGCGALRAFSFVAQNVTVSEAR